MNVICSRPAKEKNQFVMQADLVSLCVSVEGQEQPGGFRTDGGAFTRHRLSKQND